MYGNHSEKGLKDEFWTGGQTELSLGKKKRIWVWRSSQKELIQNEIEWQGGSIPSAEPNDCMSVSVDGEKGNFSLSFSVTLPFCTYLSLLMSLRLFQFQSYNFL